MTPRLFLTSRPTSDLLDGDLRGFVTAADGRHYVPSRHLTDADLLALTGEEQEAALAEQGAAVCDGEIVDAASAADAQIGRAA